MWGYLKRFYWLLADKCTHCGGELSIWSDKKAWCKECKKEQ